MSQLKKAFTLVELLVVISIIALLLAILMPALNQVREQGRSLVCKTRLKSLALSNMVYATTHQEYFVPWSEALVTPRKGPQPGNWDERWPENRDFRNIMAVNRKIKDSGWNDAYVWTKDTLCPSYYNPDGRLFHYNEATGQYTGPMLDAFTWVTNISYGYNTDKWAAIDVGSFFPGDGKFRGFKTTDIKGPSEKLMFIDASFYQVRRLEADWTKYWDKFKDTFTDPTTGRLSLASYGQSAYRHKEGANVAFFDGHVELMKKEKVYDMQNPSPKWNPADRYPDALWDVDGPPALPE